ncbi:MAG: hypothetical protein N2645_19770 [Clostridia bacterium]|nr:hypothetical protein [Clostridia bacterium]
MQLQGLMLMLFMLVIIPIIMLSSNHILFFVIISMVLFFASVRNLYALLINYEVESNETDEESLDDLETLFELDMKKFGAGVKVAKGLIIILFLVYCIFSTNYLALRVLCALIGLYWVYDIRTTMELDKNSELPKHENRLNSILFFAANAGMLIVIVSISICMLFY